jgi:hypothetical protein
MVGAGLRIEDHELHGGFIVVGGKYSVPGVKAVMMMEISRA